MGRCIAARQHLGREDLRRNIEELRWQSPPALDDYARSVADAGRGWAIDEGNYIKGVTTIAAAIADRQEIVRYCIPSNSSKPRPYGQEGVQTWWLRGPPSNYTQKTKQK